MKLTYQAKIEVLLDKMNLLYSNIKDDEGLPKVEIQLIKKYSKELTEVIEKLENEVGSAKPEALPPPSRDVRTEAIPMAPKEERSTEAPISKKVDDTDLPPISKKVEDKKEEEVHERKEEIDQNKVGRSSLTFIDEPSIPIEDKIVEKQQPEKQQRIEVPSSENVEESVKNEEAISKKVANERTETKVEMDKSESDRAEIYKTLEQMKAKKDENKKVKLIGEDEESEVEDNSINTRFKSSDALVDKLNGKGITDLRTEIDLNNKFWFINSLFDGDSEDYKRAISQINEFNKFPEATTFIDSQLKTKYNWSLDDKAVAKFMEFVNRKFI